MGAKMSRDKTKGLGCCALVLVAMVGLLIYSFAGRGVPLKRAGAPTPRAVPPGEYPAMSLDFPGVRNPELIPADQVLIDDDELVIGVEAFGKARAYVRRAFENRPDRHIVHDEFGAIPVAITHCDRTGFTRVLTDKQGESSLDLRCGGWLKEQEMSLLVGTREYAQSSPDIPLADLPFVEMTWKEWREKQPETLIYLGPVGAESN
jgi:hypothetical protein